MGTKHKILEDFYDESFVLIALHSSMEDHAMAFALNTSLKSKFKRSRKDFELAENMSFPMFEWFDEKNDSDWMLFPNGETHQTTIDSKGLFQNEPEFVKHHIVPEHKEVDYFIKIDSTVDDEVLKTIQKIPGIITAYRVDCETLTSKNNLIF